MPIQIITEIIACAKDQQGENPRELSCTALILSNQTRRRQQQVLLAQRAYRPRNKPHTRELQQRVARLESALERTCQAVISFTDVVVTCLHSAKDGSGCLEESACLNQSEPLLEQTQAQSDREDWPRSSQHAGLGVLPPARNAPFSAQSMPPAAGAILEAPAFANPLGILYRCSDIPYFKLGGRGTHYSEVVVSSQNQTESGQEQHSHEIRIHVRSVRSGGYLRAHGVALSMAPPVEDTAYRTVNAVDFAASRLNFPRPVMCAFGRLSNDD
ncbi:hypothetical protein BDW60DRAFT_219942 [Aspergillus nidulans var. acristatus]